MTRFGFALSLVACVPVPQPPAPPVVPAPAAPQSAADPTPLYGAHEVLDLEIAGPLRQVWRDRRSKERRYFDATLTIAYADGPRTIPVRIKVKGRTRAAQCEVPPYKLKVDPETVAGTLFAGQRVMRVFTHCRDEGRYEQRTLKEYLIYRTLNLLTDWSLRARLVRVTYHDTERNRTATHFAVFTEEVEQAAARTGWQELEVPNVSPRQLEPNQAALLGLFNLFIGNTDFSLLRGPPGEECCHNARLMGVPGGPFIPVPYDFDASGVIDAPYADPGPVVPVASVRERFYRGLCIHNNYLPSLFELFEAKRAEIEALYTGLSHLDRELQRDALDYYAEFFELIADPEEVADEIIGRCR